ncbi:hypothetical protein PG997_014843 [Apiospora hydei]|uniref:Uncharacterized protein n=1 Tax=Apiospora hydei TaxID=1337664 RepID=A0ABR1UUZ4_9PEZI
MKDLPGYQDGRNKQQLAPLQEWVSQSKELACPHYRINDPSLRTNLLHTIRQSYPVATILGQVTRVERTLVDNWGKPWGCPICKAAFSIVYVKSKNTALGGGLLSIRLESSRSLLKSIAKPCDSRWLAQLEPSTETRSEDARGVTWCDDASCGTSRQRRKEALLIWLLDHGVKAQVPGIDSPPVAAGARGQWLWFAFWWFWTQAQVPGDSENSLRWWLTNYPDRELVSGSFFGKQHLCREIGTDDRHWNRAAARHAATLHADADVVRELLRVSILGDLNKYRTYLEGKPRSHLAVLRDWYWERKMLRANNETQDCHRDWLTDAMWYNYAISRI